MSARFTVTRRARRILYPALAIVVALFVAALTVLLRLGTSAFPGGRIVDGHYLVTEHGRIIELTREQYWGSYWLTIAAVAGVVLYLLLAFCLHLTGDIVPREKPPKT